MSSIVLLDTSVYLNILDIPGWNQERDSILDDFETRIKCNDYFLLPMASIWETGNHIADLANGSLRRKYALKLVSEVKKAVKGDLPYKATFFPAREVFIEWLDEFPNYAQRNKSDSKTREGISLADLSIIKEWEQTKARHSMSQVLIWSLDSDLVDYDTGMRQ